MAEKRTLATWPRAFEYTKRVGISADELSAMTGVKKRTVERLTLGRPVRVENIAKILELLNSEFESNLKLYEEIIPIDESEEPEATEVLALVPEQNPILMFDISSDMKLELSTPQSNQTNYDFVTSLREEIISPLGPIFTLKNYYQERSNLPQADLILRVLDGYEKEINKPVNQINFALLFARGARLTSARDISRRQISIGEWPEFDPIEDDALERLISLHGPLIMSSSEGRRIVSDAHEFESAAWAQEQLLLKQFNSALSTELEVFTRETADVFEELSEAPPTDRHPARFQVTQLALAGSAMSVILAGAAFSFSGGIANAALLSGAISSVISALWAARAGTSSGTLAALSQNTSDIALKNSQLFQAVSFLRPEFAWVREFYSSVEHAQETSFFPNIEDEAFTPAIFLASGERDAFDEIEVAAQRLMSALGYEPEGKKYVS